jgi:hypothetical protein
LEWVDDCDDGISKEKPTPRPMVKGIEIEIVTAIGGVHDFDERIVHQKTWCTLSDSAGSVNSQ